MLILRTASGLERHAGIGQRQAMVFTDHHLHAVAKNMLAQGRSRRGGGPFFIPGVAARGVQADFRHIRGRQPGGTNAVQIFRSHPFNSFLPFGRQVQIARAEPVRPHFRGHPGSGTPAAQATDPGLFANSLQVLRKILFRQIAKLLKHQVPHLVALGAVHGVKNGITGTVQFLLGDISLAEVVRNSGDGAAHSLLIAHDAGTHRDNIAVVRIGFTDIEAGGRGVGFPHVFAQALEYAVIENCLEHVQPAGQHFLRRAFSRKGRPSFYQWRSHRSGPWRN